MTLDVKFASAPKENLGRSMAICALVMVGALTTVVHAQTVAEERKGYPANATLTVSIAKTGAIYVMAEEVALSELGRALKAIAKSTDETVVLRHHKSTENATVVRVVQEMKRAGFNKISVATDNDHRKSSAYAAQIGQMIRKCWRVPPGLPAPKAPWVEVRLFLNRNGTLAKPPEVVNQDSDAAFVVMSRSAVNAVLSCQPFALPPENYDLWREVVLSFDTRGQW